MKKLKILVINPGSTSTKVAVFENKVPVIEKSISHSDKELSQFDDLLGQYDFRKGIILQWLNENNVEIRQLDYVIGRGGLIQPVTSGIYQVNDKMIEDLKTSAMKHASSLGAFIAQEIALQIGKEAYIADPIVVDELDDIARVSGHPLYERKSVFHALNHKAIARRHADLMDAECSELRLIVAHLGGGISVGAHRYGKVVDVNQALDGEGPFSPERSGSLPVGDIIRNAFSNQYSKSEMHSNLVGNGGMKAYLGTNDGKEVADRILEGDLQALEVIKAMAYQVSKSIGEMATVLKGKVDAILLTGGMARDEVITNEIIARTNFIAPVHIYPGEDEMLALAENIILMDHGKLKAKEYMG
ncbi:butyrate kinase [Aureibacter tunicatorum]|uniref:Probable butyrate kinase n=1 Tax=Aureibacter tunicatorum TaxID=866807 RepID=A0AAE3XPP8_9BACT|nr:butyrate kinase [Aureibacter tunicatorum]MDR6241776.1 butyrate kinase [Aureibacter tunicatorum]BDD07432.1 butyrate kinase 2 [Aureibacter tunicatorum]